MTSHVARFAVQQWALCLAGYVYDQMCCQSVATICQSVKLPLRTGFEPAREYPIGFQVQRLNHSAIAAHVLRLSYHIQSIRKQLSTSVCTICFGTHFWS